MRVTFIHADGKERTEAEAEPGSILLDVAQAHLMPLEGTCEGQMACSTCHVIIDRDDFDRLPFASEEEEDMLDLAAGARRTSRSEEHTSELQSLMSSSYAVFCLQTKKYQKNHREQP